MPVCLTILASLGMPVCLTVLGLRDACLLNCFCTPGMSVYLIVLGHPWMPVCLTVLGGVSIQGEGGFMGFRVNMVSVCMWSFRRGQIIWSKELDPNLNIRLVQKEEKNLCIIFFYLSVAYILYEVHPKSK